MATAVYVQYSGLWSLSSVANGAAQANWPGSNVLYAWGLNTSGQLGLGNTTKYSSPKQVGSVGVWVNISAAGSSSFATKRDYSVWAWGNNSNGQLGLGNLTYYSSPKQIGSLKDWSNISQGNIFTLAVKTDGTLWAWGSGFSYGQLGLGNRNSYSSPKQVGALTTWSQVSAGASSSAAIRTDGTLWTWGANTFGKLGQSTYYTTFSSPRQVGSLTNWAYVYMGINACAAVKTDGTLWTWGYGGGGLLGLGNTTSYSSPIQVGAVTTWSRVSVGQLYMMALKTDGTMWSWGNNTNGELGLGNITSYSIPKQIGNSASWSLVAAGQYTAFAINTARQLWAWGNNANGELGIGNVTKYSSPKQVGSAIAWSKVSSFHGAVLALGGS